MSDSIQRSNGYLPLAPLKHADPTAVGMWDLESSAGIFHPFQASLAEARDQVVLVRLHRHPVAILHLDAPPGSEDRAMLLDSTWRVAHNEILRHTQSCPCLQTTGDAEALGAMLEAVGDSCRDQVPARPPGHVAVVVCTIGRLDVLERNLRTLTEMRCDDFEVIVVDNRPSMPGTNELVQSFASPVPLRYVAEPHPGASIARNSGAIAAADATYVAFTDDDVVVDEQWLSWLLAPFTQPGVQVVTGLVMPLSLQSAAQKRFEQYAGFGKGVDSETYDLDENRAADRFLYPYWGGVFGSGNSMAFRRDALLNVGGFDPALGPATPTTSGEDIAAFTDVVLAGGTLVYEPRSVCWHEHRDDEDGLEVQVRNYGIGLTAVFWRYLWKDWRFGTTVVRSIPLVLRLLKRRNDERQGESLPADLAQVESRGRLLGPWRYTKSRWKVRKG